MTKKINKYDSFDEMLDHYKQELANRPWYIKAWDWLGSHTWWAVYRFFTDRPWRKYVVRPWQRATRGYDETAHWSIDYHFVKVMLPAIKDLRKHSHGYPTTMFEDDVDMSNTSDEDCKKASDKWNSILDEMIEGFELIKVFHDEFGVFDTDYKTYQDEMGEDAVKDIYKKATIVSKEKHDRAFDLFKEHFYALWD
jgi:hypothetical protein